MLWDSRNLFILGLAVLLLWMLVIFLIARPWWFKKFRQCCCCCRSDSNESDTNNINNDKSISVEFLNRIEEQRKKSRNLSVCTIEDYKAMRRQTLEKLLMEV